jgi:hypothetical protein
MSEQIQNWIQSLEAEWAKPDGFLGKAREGVFDPRQGASFVSQLENIQPSQNAPIDRRLVSLIWYIPMFLDWQKRRVIDKGGDALAFEQLVNRVRAIVEEILGVP